MLVLSYSRLFFNFKAYFCLVRVGRTGRQGEAGFSYSLLTRNMAPLARGLISLLSVCDQKLEPNLIQLAEEFEAGDIEYEEEEEDNDDEKAEEKE